MKNKGKTISLATTIGGVDFDFVPTRADFTSLEGILGLISDILGMAILFSAVLAVGMIIYSGFLYITAGGDPEKISSAGKAIMAAFIGMAIAFLAKMVITFIITEFLI